MHLLLLLLVVVLGSLQLLQQGLAAQLGMKGALEGCRTTSRGLGSCHSSGCCRSHCRARGGGLALEEVGKAR